MIQLNPPVKRTIYLWSRADLANIQQTADALCDEFLSNASIFTPVDELWDNFKSICMKCLDLVPTKQVNTNSNRNGLTVILNVYLARNKDTTMELVFPNYRVAGTHKLMKKEL